jgi:acetoin utilization deacetylase AcuC-like enzyme
MHDGDGTDAILDRLGARGWVTHFNTGARWGLPAEAKDFLAALPDVARSMRDCDVVLFQAGADPHVEDPLGGWLTTPELRARDRLVFESFASLGVPVAWNLAGGYQREPDGSIPKVLEIHANTAREAIAAINPARAAGS